MPYDAKLGGYVTRVSHGSVRMESPALNRTENEAATRISEAMPDTTAPLKGFIDHAVKRFKEKRKGAE